MSQAVGYTGIWREETPTVIAMNRRGKYSTLRDHWATMWEGKSKTPYLVVECDTREQLDLVRGTFYNFRSKAQPGADMNSSTVQYMASYPATGKPSLVFYRKDATPPLVEYIEQE